MAKKLASSEKSSTTGILRAPAEVLYAEEIEALIAEDQHEKPPGWQMSARAVHTYIKVAAKAGGLEIKPKYIGHSRLVEIAISTLVTDRSLLLIRKNWGPRSRGCRSIWPRPSTATRRKSCRGRPERPRNRSAATWNYAMLIAHGPSHEALIKSPVYRAMETGTLARFEEITRCASEVQDALISLLSEKRLSVPELLTELPAQKGFSVIATANTRDRGVNDMSAALKRRFNIVVLPTPGRWRPRSILFAAESANLPSAWSFALKFRRTKPSKKWSRFSANCGPARLSMGRTNSKHRPESFPQPKQFRYLPTAWRWRRVSARARSRRMIWPPDCKDRLSRTKKRTAAPGKNT